MVQRKKSRFMSDLRGVFLAFFLSLFFIRRSGCVFSAEYISRGFSFRCAKKRGNRQGVFTYLMFIRRPALSLLSLLFSLFSFPLGFFSFSFIVALSLIMGQAKSDSGLRGSKTFNCYLQGRVAISFCTKRIDSQWSGLRLYLLSLGS